MGYLPSKNFITLVFAALIILFVGWFVIYIIPAYNLPAERPSANQAGKPTSFLQAYEDANRDSDNDGLKDWEEILWKTDPLKADTDGDGTPDNEEVREAAKIPEDAKTANEPALQTLTDRIAQRFAVEYLTTQGATGGTPDTFQKKSLSESLIESLAREALIFRDQFGPESVSADKNVSAKSYLNELGAFLDKNFAELKETEIGILDQALTSSDFEVLKKLDAYITAYKRAVEFLKKEKVSENYISLHLELMNILNNAAFAAGYMAITDKDPARGLMGLSIYVKQAERAPVFYKNTQNQISRDGVSFALSEGGYHFTKRSQ